MKRDNKNIWFFTIGMVVIISLLSGCAMLQKLRDTKSHVYLRADVNTSESKILTFPLLLKRESGFAEANKNVDDTSMEALVGSSWAGELGKDNVVPVPKAIISEIPKGWESLGTIVRVLDTASAVEQTIDSPEVKKLIKTIGEKTQAGVGDLAMGFALVFEDEETFKATKVLHGNMGLFDTKQLTWKWITKVEFRYKVPVTYEVAIQDLFAESWKILKEKNEGAVR